jgi:hypothetical protein
VELIVVQTVLYFISFPLAYIIDRGVEAIHFMKKSWTDEPSLAGGLLSPN